MEKQKEVTTIQIQNLNPEQQKAVLHTQGPLLVIAGAGSGKTRVITNRITHMICTNNVHPMQIIALTFTNKAAQEMKERIKLSLGEGSKLPFIGTFHSYCLYLLRVHKEFLPFENFSIFDEDDKHTLLTQLLKKSPLYKRQTAQQISYLISKLKNQTLDETQQLSSLQDPHVRDLVAMYEKEKRASNAFDFDDLLVEGTRLLLKHESVRAWHHSHVRHILVDEYQDTNHVQHELLKLMGLTKDKQLAVDSVCAVGDEDQSIYSWRGATVDNIMYFQNDFKGTTLIKMEQNYRSKEPILQVANTVIQNNSNRNEKKLWSDHKGSDCVRTIQCLSGYQEADIIGRYCELLSSTGKLTDSAILYRTHFQSRLIEEALLKYGIPYTIIGGIRFYERKEIKDIIAFIRLIINPFDRMAFSRVINCPARGLGDVFQELFLTHWSHEPLLNVHQISEKLLAEKLVVGTKAKALETFLSIFKDIRPTDAAPEAVTAMISASNYIAHLKETYEKNEAQERIENLQEFINAAHFFASQGKQSLESLLNEISLLQEKTNKEQGNVGVTLMTIHAAKGLEFAHVIIAGMEENLFPSSRSLATQEQLEEERRLFYVAITRARNNLLITNARFRQTYGTMEEQISSRFIDEIPRNYCRFDQAGSWQMYEVKNYFSQWLKINQPVSDVMVFNTYPIKKKESEFSFEQPARFASQPESEAKSKLFKKHQTVKHTKFGLGIVQSIEHKTEKTLVTARFKDGLKTIDGSFLTTV
jgi:DNA helicase-2/ATP-dependent DNA helicase PcrA